MMRNTGRLYRAVADAGAGAPPRAGGENRRGHLCQIVVGDPLDSKNQVGPAANERQFHQGARVTFKKGIEEGASCCVAAPAPAGLERVTSSNRPFSAVSNNKW